MLLDISDTLQFSTHVLTGRVAGLSRKSYMDICSHPTGTGVNHIAIDLALFLCACYNADMLPTYQYVTCWLNIVSTSADTVFGHVADMSVTCQANTHVSVDSTIFSTFKNPTFPAKLKMLSSISPVNDSPLVYKNMPVLFTSMKNYPASKSLFDDAIYEIAEDDAEELFHSKNICTNHDCRIGEYCFCEAIKVDLAESEDKR